MRCLEVLSQRTTKLAGAMSKASDTRARKCRLENCYTHWVGRQVLVDDAAGTVVAHGLDGLRAAVIRLRTQHA